MLYFQKSFKVLIFNTLYDYFKNCFILLYINTSILNTMFEKKLRIACVHGFGTNASFLQRQMRSFRKQFEKDFQFVFLDGSYHAPSAFILDNKVLDLIKGDTRSWSSYYSYKYHQQEYSEKVLKGIEKYFKDEEYDGIIGFSQGAIVTHFLISMQNAGRIDWKGLKNLRFCIIACGNHWEWDEMGAINKLIELPSIHLVSQQDFLYKKSIFVATRFKDPLIIHHQFGHSFPRLGKNAFFQIRNYLLQSTKQLKQNILMKSKL